MPARLTPRQLGLLATQLGDVVRALGGNRDRQGPWWVGVGDLARHLERHGIEVDSEDLGEAIARAAGRTLKTDGGDPPHSVCAYEVPIAAFDLRPRPPAPAKRRR